MPKHARGRSVPKAEGGRVEIDGEVGDRSAVGTGPSEYVVGMSITLSGERPEGLSAVQRGHSSVQNCIAAPTSAFALYIAASAWCSSVSAVAESPVATAMPMLTVSRTSEPKTDERLVERVDDAPRDRGRLVLVAHALAEHGELVAAEPRDEVARAHRSCAAGRPRGPASRRRRRGRSCR